MSRTIQLSFSGLSASFAPDGFSETGRILEIGGAEQSHVDVARPDFIFYEYLRRVGNLVDFQGDPGVPLTVAHLGAGALTLVRYIQATRPGSTQLAVDIERELPGFVMEQLPLPEGTNCTILIEDAAAAASRLRDELGAPGGLDLVVLDIFSGWEAPPHLTTAEFYTDLREALVPATGESAGGLLAVNVGDDAGLSFFVAQARTLLEVFEHVWCLADTTMLSGRYAGNLILVGSPVALSQDAATYLVGAGPHPASVLGTDELVELLNRLG